MSRRVRDLTGQTFGHLTVEARAPNGPGHRARWQCRCACGARPVVLGQHLVVGDIRSCGCARSALLSAAHTRHGGARDTGKTPEYQAWRDAIDRCERPGNAHFADYGGRGIRVHPEWRHDFAAFLAHIGPRPAPHLTLERIDNAKGYEPGNVRWTTHTEQARNTRRNRHVTVRGERMTVAEAAARFGLPKATLLGRLARAWSDDAAALTPIDTSCHHHARAEAVHA